jgi:ABC-type lipoprotein release transport system permease subunit
VYSPRNLEKKGEEVYLPMELTVTGIFESGMYEYDYRPDLHLAGDRARTLHLGNAVQGIEITTDDPIIGAQPWPTR